MTLSIYIFTSLSILFCLMPLVRNDYWTFRIFDYPRIQKLFLVLLSLLLVSLWTEQTIWKLITLIILVICAVYLSYQILPFTVFWRKEVLGTKQTETAHRLRLLISNVYEPNDNYAGCLQMIRQAKADLVFLLETNTVWAEQLSELDKHYPYSIKHPLDNTYGMLFFSKFPIRNASIQYLVEDDVPSIDLEVQLPSGQWIQAYGLHPKPPAPNENTRSTERDLELMIIAKKAVDCSSPVLVFGDLNDVAWSYTTEQFLKKSKLLDPRRGRAFLNTFNAKSMLMRFPLDHVFCSADFRLIDLKLLDNYDSDHFPVLITLYLESQVKRGTVGDAG